MADNAVDSLLGARDRRVERGQGIRNAFERLMQFQQEMQERKRQESAQKLTYVDSKLDDVATWRDTPPEMLAGMEVEREKIHKDLELPYSPKADPRPAAVSQAMRQIMLDKINGVGVDLEGNLTDLAFLPMRLQFGDSFLNGHFLDAGNEILSGEMAAPPPEEEGGKPAEGAQKPAAPVTKTKAEKGVSPIGDWTQAVREAVSHVGVKPKTPQEKRQDFEKSLEAYAVAEANGTATPQMRTYLKDQGNKIGEPVTDTDLDILVAGVKGEQAAKTAMDPLDREYKETMIANTKTDNLRQEMTNLESEIRKTAATGDTWEQAQTLTRTMRERLYDVRQKQEWSNHPERKPGELPKNYGMIDNATWQQDRQYNLSLRKQDSTENKAVDALEIQRGYLALAQTREGRLAAQASGKTANAVDLRKEKRDILRHLSGAQVAAAETLDPAQKAIFKPIVASLESQLAEVDAELKALGASSEPPKLKTKFSSGLQGTIAEFLKKKKAAGKMPDRAAFLSERPNKKWNTSELGKIWDHVNEWE